MLDVSKFRRKAHYRRGDCLVAFTVNHHYLSRGLVFHVFECCSLSSSEVCHVGYYQDFFIDLLTGCVCAVDCLVYDRSLGMWVLYFHPLTGSRHYTRQEVYANVDVEVLWSRI